MRAAVTFGLIFHCSPFEVLDRPETDWPAVRAVLWQAERQIEAARKDSGNGKR